MGRPQWAEEAPEIWFGLEYIWNAYWDLDTARSYGMSMGPIPHREIMTYASELDLSGDSLEQFATCIKSMDTAHRKFSSDKAASDAGG